MNEENKKQDSAEETETDALGVADENESAKEELESELEQLKNTFQEKYDETVEEAEAGPVIQELEEGEEEEEEDEEEEADENDTEEEFEIKPKKKRKKGKIIAITLSVLVLVTIIGSLGAYMVASVTNPNFSSFISAYSQAAAAETYEDRVNYLETALTYCSDKDSVFQAAMAATVKEEIVVAIFEEEGYAAAYSYMQQNLSESQLENPTSSDFKKIVKITEKTNKLALEMFGKVYENLSDADTLPEADVLSKGLDIPEEIKEDVQTIISSVGEAFIYTKSAEGIEGSVLAMNYFANAYSGLVSLGADSDALARKVTVELFNSGFITEAAIFMSVAVDPSLEVTDKDFIEVKEAVAQFKELGFDVMAVAETAVSEEKTADEDILALVKEAVEAADENAAILADFASYAVKGLEAEAAHNLTEASTCFATLSSVLEAFGIDDIAVYVKTAQLIFDTGNINDASSLVSAYLTDEVMESADEQLKAAVDKMNDAFTALNAASAVFSPYYSEYYQYGTAIDFDALKEELDAIITEESNNYDKGFVNYCLYFAAMTDESNTQNQKYLDLMAQQMPDMPFIYGYYQISEYLDTGKYSAAVSYAEKLLEINVADAFAISITAFGDRINGNLDGAIEKALLGMEYNESSPECAEQLAIAYMLKGDFDAAFPYVSTLCNTSQSIKSYDLVLVFNKLYTGINEDVKTELEALVSGVNQTYTYYSVTSLADTAAIIEGTKTLEDVFMSGDYSLSD